MKVMPIAFDSLGTRSMATWIETDDVKILIDPSSALGPRRYGLPPHRKEWERLDEHLSTIRSMAMDADILIVTHYHYDHHNPDMPEIFEGKIAYLKHPEKKINRSQRKRAAEFLRILEGLPERIEFSDGRRFKHGDTTIEFSPAVPHGPTPRLGYVTEVMVDHTWRVIHTSDVEGLHLREHIDFILEKKPDLLIMDGPMTAWSPEMSAHFREVLEVVPEVIIDHHYLRDLRWRSRLDPFMDDRRIMCAAEYLGVEPDLLEARRKELWAEEK